jgi:hypothetical protein
MPKQAGIHKQSILEPVPMSRDALSRVRMRGEEVTSTKTKTEDEEKEEATSPCSAKADQKRCKEDADAGWRATDPGWGPLLTARLVLSCLCGPVDARRSSALCHCSSRDHHAAICQRNATCTASIRLNASPEEVRAPESGPEGCVSSIKTRMRASPSPLSCGVPSV